MHGIDGSYNWLFPVTGGFAVHKRVDDYEAEKRAGFSIHADYHDLIHVLTEPVKVVENEVAKVETKTYTCKCGKVFHHHLPFSSHKAKCT